MQLTSTYLNNMFVAHFHPKKSLGQNFLTNPHIVEKIIETASLMGGETVVEIGPGFGILTEELLKRAKKVIAIEKDARLFEILREKFKDQIDSGKLELIHADALRIPPPNEPYAWIANIPYSITSPLLDHFIRENPSNLPTRSVLLVQKEVAQKLCAKPPRMNVLALHVQTFGDPEIVADVSRANFKPAPKVDSAIIKIDFPKTPKTPELKTKTDYEKYFALIHKAFSQKRKMLRRTLPKELLEKAGIDPTRRPETLTLKEWAKLV
ncbi:MAG: 16S rRNA (adenine(1518)-N(6)/adenine(1519)-N(6))-dimethyltransferase RsmA [Patescibacteria group bacterium]